MEYKRKKTQKVVENGNYKSNLPNNSSQSQLVNFPPINPKGNNGIRTDRHSSIGVDNLRIDNVSPRRNNNRMVPSMKVKKKRQNKNTIDTTLGDNNPEHNQSMAMPQIGGIATMDTYNMELSNIVGPNNISTTRDKTAAPIQIEFQGFNGINNKKMKKALNKNKIIKRN